ncbi:MAG: glycosyl transferase [Kordia sp.]|nr:MAG: glycosyl transferase [Kordia sp.]
MPRFSIIIPLYNKESHIIGTLDSVFKQSFTDYEIIVVNDGSTDNSLQLVSELKHKTLFVFNNKNQGVSQARNFAMQQARGEYFAFLDADDIWLTNHLEKLNKLIVTYPNSGLYCTNYIFNYNNKFKTYTYFPTLPKEKKWSGIVPDFFIDSLVFRIALTSATAIPKEIISEIGFFDTNFTSGQDTDYWIRIALKKPVTFTKEHTVMYMAGADNRISDLSVRKRKCITFEKFKKEEKTNKSLKKFNDMCRYRLAIKYKITGDLKMYKYYKKDINLQNISWGKKIFFLIPNYILLKLWQFKQWLKIKKIDLSV